MQVNLSETYKGKRVFLTGHTGFKGSWLLLALHELGAWVKGYSLAPRHPYDLYHAIEGNKHCESVIADIRDRERLKKEILEFKPDFVFHLAAQALVIDSYNHPVETYETNVMGTIHVLDALRELRKSCASVMITTDKVYENYETLEPYPETARFGGFDPYSNSKACAELAISSYRNSFFNPAQYHRHKQAIAAARSGNVIGGGDWNENRLIPDIAKALKVAQPAIIRNPHSVRPWQHVLDPLNAYLVLGAHLANEPTKFATGYNFGPEPEDEQTVLDMCKTAIACWGSGSYEIREIPGQHHEAGLLKLAIDKAKSELGWKPLLNSSQAVKLTMDWYKNAEENELDYTRSQIRSFFQLG